MHIKLPFYNMSRILIVTPHFYPESFKCNDMAFELKNRGHVVSVMTAIPDYHDGKFHKGYGFFKKRKEIINGVQVHRSFIIPRGKGSFCRLALNYVSYTFFATLKAFWFGLTRKYDAVIVHETSPVMVGIPAVIIKKMQKLPMFFWVLDLWPESLTAAGGINNKFILGCFSSLTKWIYRNSNKILISSKGFRTSINNKDDLFDHKINYFPNWVDEFQPSNDPIPELPKGFNIIFAGNIGEAQDFPNILEAAKLLKDEKNINFIFLGDGRKKIWIEEFIKDKELTNVHCFGRFPINMMPNFYKKADILFLALKDSPIFKLTVPAKLQSYMSSGKPILAMINGEGTDLIKDADCGWSVPAGDYSSLAKLILKLSKEDPEILNQKGQNGKKFSQKYFSFATSIDKLESMMLDHLNPSSSPFKHQN